MKAEALVASLAARGVLIEPEGYSLAVEPVSRLRDGELEEIRARKSEILDLFATGRLIVSGCPGEGCSAVLCALDGIAFCNAHAMTIRFVERPQ